MAKTTTLGAEARRRLRGRLHTQWASQQQIGSRAQAKDLVHALCADMGLSPANVWRAIERRTPTGLFILYILDADIEAALPRGRPRELVRRRAIYHTVQDLIREGVEAGKSRAQSETDAFRKAPAILAKREPPIIGADGSLMESKSVRNSYRKVDPASIWFEDLTCAEEPATPQKPPTGDV
ncbi:hypothetical protein [Kaistia sp. UC242_56]|uniref:hypothetical protein n=1 Tax=Kaistia sp. UC242_56 TaxID=3374625 RepID=UPI0037AF957A